MNVKFKKQVNKKRNGNKYWAFTAKEETKSHCGNLAFKNMKDSILSAVKYSWVKILSSMWTGYRYKIFLCNGMAVGNEK